MPDSLNTKPAIDASVIAPNYNNGRFLDDFIHSVIQSTVYPLELIIIDDGSTDNSVEILKKYSDLKWLRLIIFEKNRGLTEALNAGLEIAKGKYIFRADPDDVLLPNRLEIQYRYLEDNHDVDVLGSNVLYFSDKNSRIINKSNFPVKHDQIYRKYLKGEHGVQHPTVAVRAEKMLNYRYGKEFPAEDYELFARMIKDGLIFANIEATLYRMRIHDKSSTSTLAFEGIKRTFRHRDKIFGTRSRELNMRIYYLHIKSYRKFQLAESAVTRIFYLFIASICYPQKIFNRITNA